MRDFTKLTIWQRSHQLTLKIYTVTKLFPKEEMFGIISQMRRSSSSVPTNIAEGCGRNSNPQLLHFLQIACGSLSELSYQLILSKDLFYLEINIFNELYTEASELLKMMYAYSSKL
jgi:four helix bundle protein